MQHLDFPELLELVSRAEVYSERFVLVDSPPGAGKTLLVENLAAHLAHHGRSVAVATLGFEQSLAFVRRLRSNTPDLALTLWMGQERTLPADLADQATKLGRGRYRIGVATESTVHVATISKFAVLGDVFSPVDVLLVDEAYQATFSTYEPLLDKARLHVLIGDPGQLAPTVKIDTDVFETLRFRPHLPAPVEIARHNHSVPRFQLNKTYRFPGDTAALLQAFYPQLSFSSALLPEDRRVKFRRSTIIGDAIDRALDALAVGCSHVCITLQPAFDGFSSIDHEAAEVVAEVMARLIQREPEFPDGQLCRPRDVGCVEPHVATGDAIRHQLVKQLGSAGAAMVSTPEVWQGLERPFIVTRHPVAAAPSRFDLDPGRLCVAASRHRFGCIMVARANVGELLVDFQPNAGQRPLGAENRAWQGARAHKAFWTAMHNQGRVFPVG